MNEKISLLYVDDSRLDREIVRDALEQDGGYVLTEASSREEFERRLATDGPYALVLSDFNILGFDGLAVLDSVRSHWRDVPVIIVTGTGSEEVAVEAMKRGAADYVLKTVPHIKRLPQTIRRVLAQNNLEVEKREAEQRQRAVLQVREAIWQMQSAEDIRRVVDAVRQGLKDLGIDFAVCGVNLVDGDKPSDVKVYNVETDGSWIEVVEATNDLIIAMWQAGGVHYRPDVQAGDMRQEGEEIARIFAQPVHTVVDVVFAHGTLAVNSEKIDAFSARDIEAIQELAQALEEGFKRLGDLRRLEEANQRLQLEIAERRAMEVQLLHSERLRVLGELAAGVSHNLNNILTGIIIPTQLLKRGIDDPLQAQQSIEDIFVSGQRAADLVKRLGRSVHGDQSETMRSVEVNQVINEVVQATRPRWQDETQGRGVQIELDLNLDEVPSIKGSESGLHDMLVNLIFNAVDAMPKGGHIEISSALSRHFVVVEVCDTGMGMDALTRQRVFEPFFTTKKDVGTGLGLATLYGTVRRWGGMVSVASEPGKGAAFTLRLPVWQQPDVLDEEETAIGTGTLEKARVLVVEDDPVVSSVLKSALEAVQQVDLVTSGMEALELFGTGRYDAVLIDLSLPGIPGDQIAVQMKQVDASATLILMTGWILEEGDPRRAPFDYFLQKPFVAKDLESVLHRAIGH